MTTFTLETSGIDVIEPGLGCAWPGPPNTAFRQMKMTLDAAPDADGEQQRTTLGIVDVSADSQSIIVDAPVAEVYRHCLRFEEFPRVFTSIAMINRISEIGFTCTSLIKDREVKSFVATTLRVPERGIAWKSFSDAFRAVVLLFEPLSEGSTKVTVKIRSNLEPAKLAGALRQYHRNFERLLEGEPAA